MICGGNEADDERIKRSGTDSMTSRLRTARAKIAWCIVGTAVYHVALDSSSQESQKATRSAPAGLPFGAGV